MPDNILKDAASLTPDPDRALMNLIAFREANPDRAEELLANIRPVSLLFSISQFLSLFASSHPDVLFESLRTLRDTTNSEDLRGALRAALQGARHQSLDDLMDIVRVFKKKALTRLTLRDVLNITDIVEATRELSILADVIVEESVRTLRERLRETYGDPNDNAFSVISVGKLGGNELNFSSDIDLLYVYAAEQGETGGVMTSGGVVKNRISVHEYYCKLGEQLGRFLSLNTGNGLAYRVDLRLRPGGQKGSISQSLAAYEIYYESWGMAWERAVLLRARPTGGDKDLGRSFIEMIRPFVYRKYLDFSAIEEIRRMKTKIDAAFKKDDIKRGHGGIREIEFFVQAIQLIYAGKEPLLREGNILTALHRLLQKNLVGHGDYSVLNDNYLFLRKLEHRLQQLNDLQTHSLPSDGDELASLGRKMGFHDSNSFVSSLEERRRMVRSVYDSLFVVKGESISRERSGTSHFFDEDISTGELSQALSRYHLKDPEKAIRNIMHIRDATRAFQTLRGRRLLDEILPVFVLEALKTSNPDTALNNLEPFASLLASEEAYLELFTKNETLVPTLARIFSMSEYLSKTIIKRPEYLDLVGHEMFFRKSLASLKEELSGRAASGAPLPDSIRMLRQMEEIRLGTLFLEKRIDAVTLVKGLSRTAEAVVSLCADELVKNGLAIIGMGKAGGRELTFDSDLDLIFVSQEEPDDSHIRAAERLIRLLSSYTKDGIAYRVDVRLRPDGTRGPLISTLKALEQYYSSAAHFWEFQALLKARPISGQTAIGCSFMEMRKEILRKKGSEVSASDIRTMRERIRRELSREKEGYDLKLGPGGIEELEFTVQFLQLTACHRHGGLLVQGSLDAIKRLAAASVIGKGEADALKETYIFYRTLESFLRLRGETVVRKGSVGASDASDFMGLGGSGLPDRLEERSELVQGIFRKYLH